jgi:hypothetical protein
MMDVILFSQAKNDNIINVTFGKGKTIQNLIHNFLKFCKGPFSNPIIKIATIIPIKMNTLKCCFDFVTFSQW